MMLRKVTLSGGPCDGSQRVVLYGRDLIDATTGARYAPRGDAHQGREIWSYVEPIRDAAQGALRHDAGLPDA